MHDAQRHRSGGDGGRRQTGGEDECARRVLQEIDYRLLARDEAADRRQRLAERAHDKVHVVQNAQMFGRARAGFTQHTDAVRFVHKSASPVLLRHGNQAAQSGDVAFHAEHAFGNNQHAFIPRAVFKAAFEMVEIVVTEPHHARVRPQRTFHQTGVQVVVADHACRPYRSSAESVA